MFLLDYISTISHQVPAIHMVLVRNMELSSIPPRVKLPHKSNGLTRNTIFQLWRSVPVKTNSLIYQTVRSVKWAAQKQAKNPALTNRGQINQKKSASDSISTASYVAEYKSERKWTKRGSARIKCWSNGLSFNSSRRHQTGANEERVRPPQREKIALYEILGELWSRKLTSMSDRHVQSQTMILK